MSTEPRSFGVPGLDMGDIFEETELKGMELWIDDRGFQRRLAMEMFMGDFGTVTMDMRMFDFNQDIRIEPPKDFTELP